MKSRNHLAKRILLLKKINSRLNDLEALAGVESLKSVPTHLEIDFSSKCNLRCLMCHQSKMAMGSFQLAQQELDTLIDILPYVETVMIAGLGEPLLYKGLQKFLPFLSRYHCQAHIFTNGELIHKYLDTLAHVKRISISFDGASKETFEYLRSGAHFEHIVANVRKLRGAAKQSQIVTSTVVSRHNLHEVTAIIALAIELGIDEVHLSPVDHTPALALQAEDFPVFQKHLFAAEQLAAQARLKLYNNIYPEHFKSDRNSLITKIDHIKVTELKDDKPVAILVSGKAQTSGLVSSIHQLDLEAEAAEIETRIARQSAHLASLESDIKSSYKVLEKPYCSAPWKYTFARSNAQARLCPYADISVGKVKEVLGGNYNSGLLQQVRHSLATTKPMLSVCTNCTDDHRNFRSASLESTLAKYH